MIAAAPAGRNNSFLNGKIKNCAGCGFAQQPAQRRDFY
jgi:ribosomal protein L37E